ncbi:MAG: LamG-like jellyroll fold domain-containing protein [Desulfococcaceae bacterium]|jgi:hypothetical protein|nr:LamG-like jellyroll fold domain-containing protein [Desulfococcaceae bacterium]
MRKMNLFIAMFLLAGLVSALPLQAAKTFELSSETAGNPAAEFYSRNFQAAFDTDWMKKAALHRKARQGESWSEYLDNLTKADLPDALPEIPETPEEPGTPVCEAEGNGQCFYISAENGDDSNPGTYEKPWKTYRNIVYYYYEYLPENHVRSLHGGLQPGDAVYFMSGEYSDTYVSGMENGEELRHGFYLSNIHGSESAPIVFAAYPGENPVFSAKMTDQTLAAVEISYSSHVIIDGFEISDASGQGLLLRESRDTEIRNCHIHGTGGMRNADQSGIFLSAVKDIYLHHNLLHDNYGREGEEDGGINSNIRISQGGGEGGNILIRRNMIFYSDREENAGRDYGILFSRSGDQLSFPDAVFEADHNIFWNCSAASLAAAVYNSRIHHNLILDSAPLTFAFFNDLAYFDGNIIENNSIIGGPALFYDPVSKYALPGSLIFRNNINIDKENEYNAEKGILRICPDCDDSLYDRFMSEDRLVFSDNIYCNAIRDLNLTPAWLFFNNNSASSAQKGDAHTFPAWQDLGMDSGSQVFYGYTTPETALYPFDGNANDTGGEENHAVANGAELTRDRFGMPDAAYDFNGTDSYIATPLDVNPPEMPLLTMSAWVWPRQISGDSHENRQQILSYDNGGFGRSLLMESDNWHVFTGGVNWDTQVSADLHSWQHVAVVFAENDVFFYKNGEKYSFGSAPGKYAAPARFLIGNNPVEAWNEFFNGVIDDVRIYNRVLSEEEILALTAEPAETLIPVSEDLSMNVCVSYQEQSYSFTFDYFPSEEGIYWKMDADSFTAAESSGSCIEVSENLDLEMPVSYDGKAYRFLLRYETPPEIPEGLYWKMDVPTFHEIRNCIPITEDLVMNLLVEEEGNRYAFTILPYDNPNDPAGLYWQMDEESYQEVNHVTKNYISLDESRDLNICVRYQDIRLGVILHFYPSLSGKRIWKLDPASVEEY